MERAKFEIMSPITLSWGLFCLLVFPTNSYCAKGEMETFLTWQTVPTAGPGSVPYQRHKTQKRSNFLRCWSMLVCYFYFWFITPCIMSISGKITLWWIRSKAVDENMANLHFQNLLKCSYWHEIFTIKICVVNPDIQNTLSCFELVVMLLAPVAQKL